MSIHLEPSELRTAERVAQRVGGKWSAVEVDDLTSHLYLWLVQNNKNVERWRNEDQGEGKLYVALRREAAKYSAKEQAQRVGRPITNGNFYTPDMLARALPFMFEETPQTMVAENPVTGVPATIPSEFGNAVAIFADIRGAFYGLNPDVRATLRLRFRDGLSFEEIGEIKGITKDGAKKQVDRGLQRLADALG